MKTIAVIDDDIHIGNFLEELLQREGYAVLRAYSGTEALLLLDRRRPDLVLLGLMLPGLSGEEVLSRISGVPVMVVSAKAGVDDKVNLLLGGAADYITKPFDSRELLARIAVRLRDSAGSDLSRPLEAGDLRLDSASHAVTVRGLPVRLTKTEYAILKLFLQNPGQAIAKSVILDRISADSLWKSYKGFHALSGLSMHVPKGAIYGLVGRNGAGKTTLIRLICGLQAPTSGSCTLFGLDSRDKGIHKARRRMGAVVETPSICLDLSAADNIREQYRVLGVPSDDGVGELLELVGLANTGKKKARNFSLGMRQRLGIAIALAGDPDFLVLDEPVNGLDPQGIIETRELILKLNRERQITVLISSHILDELSRLATHYGFIDGGRMVKEISAHQLEAACRKCLRVEVTDTRALARVLDAMGLEYKVLSEGKADIFAQPVISRLAAALDKEGCQLLSAQERDESLESYFINLVGGGSHD